MSTLAHRVSASPGSPAQESAPPDRVRALVDRLETGWTLIDAAIDPVRKARLEDHWIRVLRDYEAACDQAATGGAGVPR